MEDIVKDKIRAYCEKISMKMDKLSINIIEQGYVATDGNTSIMFDKEGNVSSLPMYHAYGKPMAKLMGKVSLIYLYIILAGVILAIIYEVMN
ncbi:hypothetical protein psyc5s11_32040 [Clostridium gelidum]|uniref:Uncharacterized protein n=1 Tax=Clostridium gelidum TaxID=704125 RepID=A0ABN6IYH6_9CLOT|nr:hypothetical protein [Clostridium gelidum]BCZ47137.1 hypothetical protein psyc5s11_32040 [Clostridium gelidum]